MDSDGTDFTVCPHPHGRSPYAHTGGDDAVQLVFLQITAGIFPEKINEKVAWKNLTVMGVTG